MKHSKHSKQYKEAWLFLAVVALMVLSHEMSYQELLMNKYWYGK